MVDLESLLLKTARGELSPQTQLVVYANGAAPHDITRDVSARQGITVTRAVRATVSLKANSPALGLGLRQQTLRVRRADRVITRTRSERARRRCIPGAGVPTSSSRWERSKHRLGLLKRAIAIELAALTRHGRNHRIGSGSNLCRTR